MERTYTVQRVAENTPCITIRGKWLKKFGLDLGSRVKLIEDDNVLILFKIPDSTTEKERQIEEIQRIEEKLTHLKQLYSAY